MTSGLQAQACRVKQLGPEDAGQFIREHKIENPFLAVGLLEAMCNRVDWWLASWRGNPVCLWPICITKDNKAAPPDLTGYVGPALSTRLDEKAPHSRYRISHAAILALLDKLSSAYGSFACCLHPDLTDVRPFQWFSEQSSGTVEIVPHSTALLDLNQIPDDQSLISGFSRSRRRDIHGLLDSLTLSARAAPVSALQRLYRARLATKGAEDAADARRQEVLAILEFSGTGSGFTLQYGVKDEALSGFISCVSSARTACATLMATTKEGLKAGLPAWLIYQALRKARELGLEQFDFTGANSPIGSKEKHSYGAVAQTYFSVHVRPDAGRYESAPMEGSG